MSDLLTPRSGSSSDDETSAGEPAAVAPFVVPTRDDELVGQLSEGIGGRIGRYSWIGSTWWTPLRALIVVTMLMFGLGVMWHAPCEANGWRDDNTYIAGCYSDIGRLYFDRDLDKGTFPYADRADMSRAVEYPVLQGLLMWVPTRILGTDNTDIVKQTQRYYDITVVLLFALALIAVWATMRSAGNRPWDAMILAAAPSVVVVGTLNWDFLPVALLALAILAWTREKPWLAGILIGLGGAAKLYPLLIIGVLLLLCLRAGRMRAWLSATAMAIVAWVVVNLPFALAYPEGWKRFYHLSETRPFDFGSLWLGLRYLGFDAVDNLPPNNVATGSFVFLCAAIAALALCAPRRPRLAQLALLVVAAFLLTNKVYSPQFALWLLPLVALARPRWRDVLIWQGTQVMYYFSVWLWLAHYSNPERALSDQAYGVTIILQFASLLWIVGLVIRDIWWPQYDPVRTNADGTPSGVDDPSGGVLVDRPDRWSLGVLRRHLAPQQQVDDDADEVVRS